MSPSLFITPSIPLSFNSILLLILFLLLISPLNYSQSYNLLTYHFTYYSSTPTSLLIFLSNPNLLTISSSSLPFPSLPFCYSYCSYSNGAVVYSSAYLLSNFHFQYPFHTLCPLTLSLNAQCLYPLAYYQSHTHNFHTIHCSHTSYSYSSVHYGFPLCLLYSRFSSHCLVWVQMLHYTDRKQLVYILFICDYTLLTLLRFLFTFHSDCSHSIQIPFRSCSDGYLE
jgi:hypothetical protein